MEFSHLNVDYSKPSIDSNDDQNYYHYTFPVQLPPALSAPSWSSNSSQSSLDFPLAPQIKMQEEESPKLSDIYFPTVAYSQPEPPSSSVFPFEWNDTFSAARQRAAQACDKCRERKTKCSGDHPVCIRCTNRGLHCHYTTRSSQHRVRPPHRPRRISPERRDTATARGLPAPAYRTRIGEAHSSAFSLVPLELASPSPYSAIHIPEIRPRPETPPMHSLGPPPPEHMLSKTQGSTPASDDLSGQAVYMQTPHGWIPGFFTPLESASSLELKPSLQRIGQPLEQSDYVDYPYIVDYKVKNETTRGQQVYYAGSVRTASAENGLDY